MYSVYIYVHIYMCEWCLLVHKVFVLPKDLCYVRAIHYSYYVGNCFLATCQLQKFCLFWLLIVKEINCEGDILLPPKPLKCYLNPSLGGGWFSSNNSSTLCVYTWTQFSTNQFTIIFITLAVAFWSLWSLQVEAQGWVIHQYPLHPLVPHPQ